MEMEVALLVVLPECAVIFYVASQSCIRRKGSVIDKITSFVRHLDVKKA